MAIRKFLKKIWEILTSPIGKLIIAAVILALLLDKIQTYSINLYDQYFDEIISSEQYQLLKLLVSTTKALGISILIVMLFNTIIKLLNIQGGKPLNYRVITLISILILLLFFFQDQIFYYLFNPNQYFHDNNFSNRMEIDDFIYEIRLVFEIDLETDIASTVSPISLYFNGIEISPRGYEEYDTICFDEITFSVSPYIDTFKLKPLWGEPNISKFDYLVEDLLEYVGESSFPNADAPYCYTIEDINNLPWQPNEYNYFKFPEKKDVFNYLHEYVNEYELFYYPYAAKDIDFAVQIAYHLENDTTKSEKRVLAPPILIIYNHTNIWNYESTSIIQQTTPIERSNPGGYFDFPNWSEGPIKIVQTSISGPTFYKVITIAILIGLYLLTGFLLFIKDDADFVGAAGAILFGVFGTKQIISPSLPIAHNIIDTTIFSLYIFITMITIERVILKIVKKQG